jgi:hypothetical protein
MTDTNDPEEAQAAVAKENGHVDSVDDSMEAEPVIQDAADNEEDAVDDEEDISLEAESVENGEKNMSDGEEEDEEQGEQEEEDSHRRPGLQSNAASDADESEDEVMASVVVEGNGGHDGDEVEASVVVAKTHLPQKEPRKPPSPPRKKSPKRKKKAPPATFSKPPHRQHDELMMMDFLVNPANLAAATDARAQLQEVVPVLPISLGETQVRSFGRVFVDEGNRNEFATTGSIYPIGFSCDRFEYSPAHGRTLRMRCSILDGRAIKDKQRKCGFAISDHLPNGPVFRVMWGQGVDQDADYETSGVEYPYDVYVHSAPKTAGKGSVSAAAVGDSIAHSNYTPPMPQKGMKVKVRFDEDYQLGTIISVQPKKKKAEITIRYDDLDESMTEDIMFPDPDVTLLLPGTSI